MPKTSDRSEVPAAIQTHITAIFISLELSRKVWLVTSLSPGAGEKMSKHCVPAGDVAALLLRFAELKRKAQARTGDSFPIVTIQEAELTASGCIACWREKASRATWLIRRRSPRLGVGATPKPTGSTERRCCARCSRSSAVSRVSAPWPSRPRPRRRIDDA